MSNAYVKVSDLEDLRSFISGDGSAQQIKGNIMFYKSGYDENNTLLVAEKNQLTDNTYKSILSLIEVMFDSSKAADYFKTNYSSLSIGNKEFKGFKVEVNPSKTEEEDMVPSNSEFVRVTIDKELVKSAIKESEETNKNSIMNVLVKNKVWIISGVILVICLCSGAYIMSKRRQ